MTFLELCRKVYMRAGYSGNGPASVENQSGQSARVVDYVDEAWQEIQRSRTNWHFMRRRFRATTSPGIAVVSIANAEKITGNLIHSIDRNSWYSQASGELTGGRMMYAHSDKRRWIESSESIIVGRPQHFWESTSGIRVSPLPDREYEITGDYYITAQAFASTESDQNKRRPLSEKSPSMPEHYHMAIAYLAMRELGAFEESANLYSIGDSNYRKIFGQMLKTQTPDIIYAPPLA